MPGATPEGDIYPCHQFIGIPEFKMGNVQGSGLDKTVRERIAGNTLANKNAVTVGQILL